MGKTCSKIEIINVPCVRAKTEDKFGRCHRHRVYKFLVYDMYLGLCKLENEILKEAKNAQKSHF